MIDQEIARRMANYQKYGQLVDLLALQKLKSDKEAAIRQMQLAQAAQGEMPTVAEQREQEVLDMTKQELAGRVGGIARQQQSAQQSAMQKLLSGIAKAPGAQIAAQPQMMAAGGIVAFTAGGTPPKAKDETEEEKKEEAKTPLGRWWQEQMRGLSASGEEAGLRQQRFCGNPRVDPWTCRRWCVPDETSKMRAGHNCCV